MISEIEWVAARAIKQVCNRRFPKAEWKVRPVDGAHLAIIPIYGINIGARYGPRLRFITVEGLDIKIYVHHLDDAMSKFSLDDPQVFDKIRKLLFRGRRRPNSTLDRASPVFN